MTLKKKRHPPAKRKRKKPDFSLPPAEQSLDLFQPGDHKKKRGSFSVFTECEKAVFPVFFHIGFETVVTDVPIGGTTEEFDSSIDQLPAEFGISKANSTAINIVLLTDGGKFVDGGTDFGAAELSGFADAVAEVGWTEEEDIDPFDRSKIFRLFQCGGIFDLCHDKSVVVGELHIVKHGRIALIGILIHRINAPEPQRMEFALPDNEFKLLSVLDAGDHKPLSSGFKRLDEIDANFMILPPATRHKNNLTIYNFDVMLYLTDKECALSALRIGRF